MDANIWAWIEEYADRVMENRDAPRVAMLQRIWEGMRYSHSDPDQALANLADGRGQAEQLGEPWWVLFCDHWSLQTLLFRKRDYTRALPLALAATDEARKPIYAELPQRMCLQEDLISALQGVDLFGHAAEIEAALERMAAEISPESQCYHCLQGLRTEWLRDQGRLAEAHDQALFATKRAALASDYHHATAAYVNLCQIAFLQGDWPHLRQWAAAGEMFEGRGADEDCVAELRMWQAAATRQAGEEERAIEHYRAARSRARRLGCVPTAGFFNAWSAFHATAGDYRRALRVRDRELALLEGRGQTYAECRCRLERLRLGKALNMPIEEEARALREISHGLRDPSRVLEALEAL